MATKVYEFQMAMECDGCANAAKRVLGKLGAEVTDVKTDVDAQKVTVESSLPQEQLLEALKKTGKTVSFIGEK